MKKRLEALKKDQKGFTLVELIVVLVILAILAALLVPALLGYIDRAREAKYFEEARSIYTALQVIEDERYAANKEPLASGDFGTLPKLTGTTTTGELKEVNGMIAPATLSKITALTPANTTDKHKKYTIQSLTIEFVSQDGSTNVASMDGNGTWEMVSHTDPTPAAGD